MTTPLSIIKAYVRRIERNEITLDSIKNQKTREDVKAYIESLK